MSAELVCLRGNGSILLDKSPFRIGRHVEADFIIGDKQISRTHCVFRKSNSGWFLEDKSTNGTIINGIPFVKTISPELKDGDIITVGGDLFSYRFHDYFVRHGAVIDDFEELSAILPVAAVYEYSNEDQYGEGSPVPFSDDEAAINLPSQPKRRKEKDSPQPQSSGNSVILVEDENALEPNEVTDEKSHSKETQGVKDAIKKINDIEEELICAICSGIFIKPITLNCFHTLCEYCIVKWEYYQNKCPICRVRIVTHTRTLVLENIIDQIIKNFPTEVREQRELSIAEREILLKSGQNAVEVIDISQAIESDVRLSDDEINGIIDRQYPVFNIENLNLNEF